MKVPAVPFVPRILAVLVGAAVALASAEARESGGDETRIGECAVSAAKTFGLETLHLQLLRKVEGGMVGRVSFNANGTYDIGPMQINSTWLPKLARFGVTEQLLRDDACVNVYVAAWLYATELRAVGNDVAMALARYHSPTPIHQARYLALLRKAVGQLRSNLPQIPSSPATP